MNTQTHTDTHTRLYTLTSKYEHTNTHTHRDVQTHVQYTHRWAYRHARTHTQTDRHTNLDPWHIQQMNKRITDTTVIPTMTAATIMIISNMLSSDSASTDDSITFGGSVPVGKQHNIIVMVQTEQVIYKSHL